MIHRRAPRACAMRELCRTGGIAGPRATRTDGLFQPKQQAIEIDWDDLRGIDALETLAIGEPAGTEIPAAFGRCPHVAVQLLGNATTALCESRVLAIGFIARRVSVVPITV